MAKVILSVIGSDRPGLTRAVAEAVLSAGGNWLESHLSRLGGLYVGSVLVELDEAGVGRLSAAVKAVDASGLEVRVAPSADEGASSGDALSIELVGQDRPGIVRQVTAVLSRLEVNIEDFDTKVTAEPQTGLPLFHLDARLRLPTGLASEQLQAALEEISGEIMVDISLGPAR